MYKRLLAVLTALSLGMICLVGCGGKQEENLAERGNDVYDIYTNTDLKTKDMVAVSENPKEYIGKSASFLLIPTETGENDFVTKGVVAKINPDYLYRSTTGLKSDINIALNFNPEQFPVNPMIVDNTSDKNYITYFVLGEITDVDDNGLPVIEVYKSAYLSTYSDMVALDYVFKDNPKELDELNIEPLINTSISGGSNYDSSDEPEKDFEDLEKTLNQTNETSDKIIQNMSKKFGKDVVDSSINQSDFEYFIDKNGDYWITMSSFLNSFNEYYKKAEKDPLSMISDDINLIRETTVFFLPKDGLDSLEGLETKVDYVDPISIIFE